MKNDDELMMANGIEKTVAHMTSSESKEMRRKVKEMSMRSREAFIENGSFFALLGKLVSVVLGSTN